MIRCDSIVVAAQAAVRERTWERELERESRVDELHLAAVVSPCYFPLSRRLCPRVYARDSKELDLTPPSVRVAKATNFVALRVNCVESRNDCL